MKSAVFIILLVLPSIWLASITQPTQPDNPEPVPLQTAACITLNSGVLIASHQRDSVYANLYFDDVADVLVKGEPHTIPGRAFLIAPGEWVAVDTTKDPALADYVRVNAKEGKTTVRIAGKERTFCN